MTRTLLPSPAAVPNRSSAGASPWIATRWIPAAILALAAGAAYHNAFPVPLLFDDRVSILENPTIRQLWPLSIPLSPPREFGLTVSGRPVVNLSLALNYAISGTQVWSYHAFNLTTHVLAGLTLFGLVRRTLQSLPAALSRKHRHNDGSAPLAEGSVAPLSEWRATPEATPVALAIALLWTLHPLQTESVTYLIQRSESLMGLFYLLTLYGFVRSVESSSPRAWQGVAVGACLIGMGCKEVMVSAPVIVWLYDRTFVAGGFRAAWNARRGFYLALAGTWLLLAALVASTGGNRGGTMGFDVGTGWTAYWLVQCDAITHYLRLAFWPHPLVFEYGRVAVSHLGAVWPQFLFVSALVLTTVVALVRRPVFGFPGAWFLCVLAPTSLVPGQMQAIVEHRVYLALAPLLALVVVTATFRLGRRVLPVCFALAGVAGVLTAQRNRAYESEIAIWTDTIAHRPNNVSAHINLGVALLEANRASEALTAFENAARLRPDSAVAHANLATALLRVGRFDRAREHGETAVRLDPANVDAQVNLGLALVALDRTTEAIPHFERALQLQPGAADVHVQLGAARLQLGQTTQAAAHYRAALQLDSSDAATWFALANLLAADAQFAEAIAHYRRALDLAPDYLAARNNLANALLVHGQIDAAIAEYERILRERPDDHAVRENLARARELQTARRSPR